MEADSKTKRFGKHIENMLFATAYLSVVSCLCRSDFNVPFSLLCYYMFIAREGKQNVLIIMLLLGLTILIDFIWFLSVANVWTSPSAKNYVWNSFADMHNFVIVVSVFEFLLKFVIIALLKMILKECPDYERERVHRDSAKLSY